MATTTNTAPGVDRVAFDALVSENAVILADFWAPWCPPCRAIAPTIDSLASRFAGRAKIVKINVDEQPELASRFNVRSIPTLVLLKGADEVERFVGVQGEGELAEAIEGLVEG
jgi:thioredoxin